MRHRDPEVSSLFTQYQIALNEFKTGKLSSGFSRLDDVLIKTHDTKDSTLQMLHFYSTLSLVNVLCDLGKHQEALDSLDRISQLTHNWDESMNESQRSILEAMIQVRRSTSLIGLARAEETLDATSVCLASNFRACYPYALTNRALAFSLLGDNKKTQSILYDAIAESTDLGDLKALALAAWNSVVFVPPQDQLGWAFIAKLAEETSFSVMIPIPKELRQFATHATYSDALALDNPNAQKTLSMLEDCFRIRDDDILTSFDIDLNYFLLAVPELEIKHTHLILSLNDAEPPTLMNYLIGLISTFRLNDGFIDFILKTFLVQKTKLNETNLKTSLSKKIGELIPSNSEYTLPGGRMEVRPTLCWNSQGPWPWALAPILTTLSLTYLSSYIEVREQRAKFKNLNIAWFPQGHGVFLHPLYENASAAGAADLGFTSPPRQLSRRSILEQLSVPRKNITSIKNFGKTEEVAQALHKAGIVVYHPEDLNILTEQRLVHSDPSNFDSNHNEGSIFDCQYGLDSVPSWPLYGRGYIRDLSKQLMSSINVKTKENLRAGPLLIPVVEACDNSTLEEIISHSRRITDQGHLYFRGQTRTYLLREDPIVLELLYGDNTTKEVSLMSASARSGVDYRAVHAQMQLAFQDALHEAGHEMGIEQDICHFRWLEAFKKDFRGWHLSVMAMAQHFGVPTDGLDVTESAEIAMWFAFHSLKSNNDGYSAYHQLDIDWRQDQDRRPILFILAPEKIEHRQSFFSLRELGMPGLHIERPRRQKGVLFSGADTSERNRLALCLLLAVELGPNISVPKLTEKQLFPGPNEDPACQLMHRMNERYFDTAIGPFLDKMPRYRT